MLRSDLIRAEFVRRLDGMGKVESGIPVKASEAMQIERTISWTTAAK